ncbi:glutamine synthetase family protein [Marinobacterium lacunae]|uniref:Glutamine synthetase family protein n=1 Tax=Marinobacterium lacunae TaxID=1232683 RepID=A0A081FTC4_9GAMM|nr:glutamine synthetase family protein [Marinobacterium lacunae]KEA61779.1 glutamine synthetase family protein [Marinobacterium lacunae]
MNEQSNGWLELPDSAEAETFLEQHPDLQFVDLLIADMNGIVRGKRIDRSALKKVFEKGVALPASLYGLDILGETVESTGLGLEIGEADHTCYPIPGTLTMEPWQTRPIAQLLMTMYEDEDTPFYADPRTVLKRVIKRFDELELTPVTAFELEFYLIDQENIAGKPQPPKSPISGKRPESVQVYSIDELDEYADFLSDVIETARSQGIPADTIVAESAPGQFEINLHHVADPIKSCDNATLLRRVIKSVAYDHEMDTTFMAKPYADQAGNGMHLHISLVDKNGKNVFELDPEDETPNDIMRWAVGGLIETMDDYLAILCPNINSYRRFSQGFYVPTWPCWGIENRTTALRIPQGEPEAARIEHRLAGTDSNPYLLMAAMLSAIHFGITHKIEPPPPVEGNAYQQQETSLPNNLRDALRELESSGMMREYFGNEFLNVFIACKEHEVEQFERTISDLEYTWYLHTV